MLRVWGCGRWCAVIEPDLIDQKQMSPSNFDNRCNNNHTEYATLESVSMWLVGVSSWEHTTNVAGTDCWLLEERLSCQADSEDHNPGPGMRT